MTESVEIYVPAVAEFPKDLKTRFDLLEPVRKTGYQTGLMLVIRPQGLTEEKMRQQLDNLDPYLGKSLADRPRIFAMHPNMPIIGKQRFNFFNNPAWSQDYLANSIEMVARLPDEFTPATGRSLSFHLNTLLYPTEWQQDKDHWDRAFDNVLATVNQVSQFAQEKQVNLAVETVPITEFGDTPHDAKHLMEDGKTYWAELGNPWPLLPWRDEISRLREAGLGLVIDFCHSFIALKTVNEAKRLAAAGREAEALATYMLFTSDLENASPLKDFTRLVEENTQDGDIWHVNDGKGLYQINKLQGSGSSFEEGKALFTGEIPPVDLKRLVQWGLGRPIKFVVEVNETDFVTNPNTTTSLNKILELV